MPRSAQTKTKRAPATRARRPSIKDRVADRVARAKPSRAQRLPVLPSGPVPCLSCGLCCGYVAVEIDGPETLRGATDILWYLYHPGVSVYVDEDEWMVQFETRCQHQLPDNRCGIYETRPQICREYDETTCEVNAEEVGRTLYSVREFFEYLETNHKRINTLVRKRFMPPEDSLDGRVLNSGKLLPFGPRYEALRLRRTGGRPPKAR